MATVGVARNNVAGMHFDHASIMIMQSSCNVAGMHASNIVSGNANGCHVAGACCGNIAAVASPTLWQADIAAVAT